MCVSIELNYSEIQCVVHLSIDPQSRDLIPSNTLRTRLSVSFRGDFCYPDYSGKKLDYRLVKPGWAKAASLTICVILSVSSINFLTSQPIYFILTHIVA